MSEGARVTVGSIGDWYVTKNHTYIRIYIATKAPYILPKYVIDHVILSKIAYQTFVHKVGASLVRKRKESWPNLPVFIRAYSFDTSTVAEKMAESLQTFHFGEERFRRHDPKKSI